MLILRSKIFAAQGGLGSQPQQPPNPLQQNNPANKMIIEQMKTEREKMKTLRKVQEADIKDRQTKIKSVLKQQADDRRDKINSLKERAKIAQSERAQSSPSNTYLYKTKSIPTPPVPMK